MEPGWQARPPVAQGFSEGLGVGSWVWVFMEGCLSPSPPRSTGRWGLSSQEVVAMADPLFALIPFPPGYSLVTHIPAGARDIQIVERKKSADVLGT